MSATGGTPLDAIFIEDPSDPRLTPYLNQKDAWLRAPHNPLRQGPPLPPSGLFIAEGDLVVEQLLRSSLSVESILTTDRHAHRVHPLLHLRASPPTLLTVPQPLMDDIAGFHVHRGVLAAGIRPDPPDLSTLLHDASLVVLLVDLANHDNVGGIFRAVAALAGPAAAVLLTPASCDPLYRKAIRVSMGHVLRTPWAWAKPTPEETLDMLARAGFVRLALATGGSSLANFNPQPGTRLALIVGPEGPGLDDRWLAGVDHRLRIPMAPGVDSLNVTVATAIALHTLASPELPAPGNVPKPL